MFVHLHGHTYWSLLDGAARPEAVMQRAAALGMPGVAVTDHGVMYGIAECYLAAQKIQQETGRDFRFVPGVETYVAPRSRFDKDKTRGDDANWHLILWALDNIGLSLLYRLVSRTEMYYKPRIDKGLLASLIEECGQGHIAGGSACLASEINSKLLQGDYAGAKAAALTYNELLGDGNFFLELQDHGLEEQRQVNRDLLRLHAETGLPLLVTNDYHYVEPDHAFLHEVLVCIQTGKQLSDENRLRFSTDQAYLKSPEAMAQLFPNQKEAVSNTVLLTERCSVSLDFETVHLPRFDIPPEFPDADAYLRHLVYAGARRRFGEISREVKERLDYELSVIAQMGYSDYFLIVWDFIRFAREQNIPVGPGRGSAAGSLVAYCLRITNIDPLRYGLLFERFLNPARVTLPDVDIDFCYHRRNEVIEYVVNKYGPDRTAQIITFGTMKARAAVRDVARVLGVSLRKADQIAKAIPFGANLKTALETSSDLRRLYEEDEEAKKVLDISRFVEGFPRHASTHAAGVVIASRPLELDMPLYRPESEKVVTPFATQYPMGILEEMKFLKMDFLALRNLSVIKEATDWIEKLHGKRLDMDAIPLDDPATYRIFSLGLTGGVFQFESEGMRRLLQEFQPESLEHLTLLNAMYRPGPMQYIPAVIRRRHGQEEVTWPHPDLKELLEETYGIMVYQEQIMAVAHRFAGFSLGQADLLRRAIGKKKQKIIDAERENFIQGARERGYDEKLARQIYSDIEKFAGYGFNKSHACAYALIAYQTAYLKAHYPTEYMAALLTSVMGKGKNVKLGEYLQECRELGISVDPPDINRSDITFVPRKDGSISFGLTAIKNLGESAARSLVAGRQERPYQSLLDLCTRAEINKEAALSLIRVGALDCLGKRRSQLEAVLEDIFQIASERKRHQDSRQASFFDVAATGFDEAITEEIDFPDIPEYGETQRLQYERELIGVYLSGHPLDQYESILNSTGVTSSRKLETYQPEAQVAVAGVVLENRPVTTRRGDEMCFLTLEDKSGPVEVIVFPRIYEKYKTLLNNEFLLVVEGRNDSTLEEVDRSSAGNVSSPPEEGDESLPENEVFQARVIATAIYTIQEWEEKASIEAGHGKASISSGHNAGHLYIKADDLEEKVFEQLKGILQAHPGKAPVTLVFTRPEKTCLQLKKDYWVSIPQSGEVISQIEDIVGAGRVQWKRTGSGE